VFERLGKREKAKQGRTVSPEKRGEGTTSPPFKCQLEPEGRLWRENKRRENNDNKKKPFGPKAVRFALEKGSSASGARLKD